MVAMGLRGWSRRMREIGLSLFVTFFIFFLYFLFFRFLNRKSVNGNPV